MTKKEQKMIRNYHNLEAFINLVLVIAVAFVIFVLAQLTTKGYVSIAGYSLFKVETGSMEPTINTGALLICEKADISEIKVGDIVCFTSKEQSMYGRMITHRVTEIEVIGEHIRLTTRGDANTVEDLLYVTNNNLVGRVSWYSQDRNVVAKMISLVTGQIGFLGCIVLPVLLVCAWILRDNMHKIQVEMRELEKLQLEAQRERERKKQLNNAFFSVMDEDEETEEELRARLCAEIRKELGLDADPKEQK